MREQVSHLRKGEVVGTFAAGVAHDFNNLLGAILGYTEMVMEELASESQARMDLENVMDAGMRAKDLVYQILAFARGTDGEGIVMAPVSLVKELAKKIGESLPQSIKVEMDIDPDCGTISMDPFDLYQILTELCGEARRVIGERAGLLKVILQNATLSGEGQGARLGEYLKLEVSYTVFPPEDNELQRHVEPFYTTMEIRESVAAGEPALVRQIVGKNKGLLITDGEYGKGTRFRIYFPIVNEYSNLI